MQNQLVMKGENNIPRHIGIVMDGNRRWAKQRGMLSIKGHAAGQDVLLRIARHAFNNHVQYLTVFAFSTENWKRSEDEVGYLMRHVGIALKKHIAEFVNGGIRVVFLGDIAALPKAVQKAIVDSEAKTAHNTTATLAICFNYGGHQEIIDATRSMMKSGLQAREVTEQTLQQHLYYPDIPNVDLLIRTSGEQRLSGFMLWRAAYSEFIFRDEYWPDFSPEILDECLLEYSNRQRRFGG